MDDEMNERPGDDTTEPSAGSRAEREGTPRNYYYDDGTGYEPYQPDDDERAGTETDEEGIEKA